MNVQNLLSVVVATMASLGTLLLAIDHSSPWSVVGMWLSAMVALVVNDFKGWFRLRRKSAWLLLLGIALVYMPNFIRADGDAFLLVSADMLVYCQIVWLFQAREEQVYALLAGTSLYQVMIAAAFSRGIGFGVLLFVYLLLGLFALSLLAIYSDWSRFRTPEDGSTKTPRSPARINPQFSSELVGVKRSGLVPELFMRLALQSFGTLVLSLVVFVSVPRLGQSWHGPNVANSQVVGFNSQITLGELGPILESRQEVMQVKLQQKGSDRPLTPLESIYLRGALVSYYSDNRWQRRGFIPEGPAMTRSAMVGWRNNVGPEVSTEVYQTTTMEPFLDRDDLFYVPPLLPLSRTNDRIMYDSQSESLRRFPGLEPASQAKPFDFTIRTGGIVQGRQIDLVPAEREMNVETLLQMPEAKPGEISLPKLTALANSCVAAKELGPDDQYEIARCLEAYLRDSGNFHYSLKGEPRDPHIDAVEDFVSQHPRGHCEYFATALALMLRSQNIPSRVALGYRCDEWDNAASCYRVRQLHAHAWVEAFLDAPHLPRSVVDKNPTLWDNGGWLRLDATPDDDLGSLAADRSTMGQWQRWFNNIQSRWDKYVVEMNHQKQQETIFQPLKAALVRWFAAIRDPAWWAERFRLLAAGFRQLFRMGLIGILLAMTTVLAISGLIYLAVRYLFYPTIVRIVQWRVRKTSRQRQATASTVEFYRRFEELLATQGYFRQIGQTQREFGQRTGEDLARRRGQNGIVNVARQLVERFYRVRFGREPLDKSGAEAVEQALATLEDKRILDIEFRSVNI